MTTTHKITVVAREAYRTAILQYEEDTKIIDTCNRTVLESYTKDGVYFASAEYVRKSPIIYRVRKDYLP